jgi:signal transduction histidine kinase
MSTNKPSWYRSLYWRVGLGFVVFLGLLLIAQAVVVVWLTGRAQDRLPGASNAALADSVASAVRDRIEEDPSASIGELIASQFSDEPQSFIVVMADGGVFSNRRVPPQLLENAQTRLAMLGARRGRGPRRIVRGGTPNGRVEMPILADGMLAGIVIVPPQRPAPIGTALRTYGTTLALSSAGLLIAGAAAAALLIFGPVRRRLALLEDAAARIGAGDVTVRAPEHGGDEVAALAASFNRMAADLQARATDLAASDQARRQLLADVSHELMTPLTAMRGYLETLAMTELNLDPATRERYLRIVDDETRRLEHIIGDLLDLARLEGGGAAPRREWIETSSLFERVAARHERELTSRGIRLTRRVGPGATELSGDPERLEQALQNLAANALRHTPDGGEISLTAEPATGAVRITVRDSGPGIAAAHLPLIFDRFYKADAARASAGSGLGLSIVKAIVERHGGTVSARNDNGAVFEVLLPVASRGPEEPRVVP